MPVNLHIYYSQKWYQIEGTIKREQLKKTIILLLFLQASRAGAILVNTLNYKGGISQKKLKVLKGVFNRTTSMIKTVKHMKSNTL